MRIGSNHDLEDTASNFTVLSPLTNINIQAMLVKDHHLVSTVNPKDAESHSND